MLTAADVSPVRIINPGGRSSFLLLGDHAGNLVPSQLGTLGLSAGELDRHIGWDIGIGLLGAALAEMLDAPFIEQRYSRLVIDCNRWLEDDESILSSSDGTYIAGNTQLSDDERARRQMEIHQPYHRAIAAEIARRDADRRPMVLVALHSFTPTMKSVLRRLHVGILHDAGDPAFALHCLEILRRNPDLIVGDNQPYHMDDTDYTVPRHAYPQLRPYVEIEIRQDLLTGQAGVGAWASVLAGMLNEAVSKTAHGPG